jgi:hypothetical protein
MGYASNKSLNPTWNEAASSVGIIAGSGFLTAGVKSASVSSLVAAAGGIADPSPARGT